MKVYFILGLAIFSLSVGAQEDINQFDSEGKRHGLWKKTFDGKEQLRYKGTFEHGQEVGTFEYYKPKYGNQPSAIITYNNSGLAKVSYFTKKGKLISKGQLKDRKRTGTWQYYHNDNETLMMRENYVDDILNGLKTTYYENENLNEEVTYKEGKMDGTYKLYSLKGVLLQELDYVNGQLHGTATYYNGKGEKTIEGNYVRNRKDGYWQYYNDGELIEEKYFSKD